MEEEVKELLNKCDTCKLKQCEGCKFTYTDIQKIRKYVEQKEYILDKVTDKLKEDINFLEFSRDRDMDDGYGEDEEDRAVRVYIESILNIIEGEKNERKD